MRGLLSFAVDKPIINHILMLFMFLLSIFAYQNIAKEIFPPSTLDQITIRGGYIGASVDVLDKMVVTELENKLKSVAEIDTVYTVVQNGSFIIRADIKPGNDTQLVLSDTKDIISSVRRDLPADMDEPLANITVHQFPLILIAISGDADKKALIDAAEDIKKRLSLINNVSNIDIRGDTDTEVLIKINQNKLDAYGLEKNAVYQAIGTISSIFPAGTMDGQGEHLYISTINGEKSAKSLSEILLSVGGKRFHLGDVAEVHYGLADPAQISHFNGKENISLNITKTKEGNAIALSKEIRTLIDGFNARYDKIQFVSYTDTSVWIKNRLNLVSSNIFFGLILVFLALMLSVNMRIAWVVAIGIPTSFMIALIAMDMIGYSLNMLTMLGALIALGMLVDEAIVVAENIYRHIEMGKSPRDAAIDGSLEMFPSILTATMTTVFAFLPLLIMSGKMGVFMKVLPVMITVLLLSSLFEAFYFLPLHAKEFFSIKQHKVSESSGGFWKGWIVGYKKFLYRLLLKKWWSLIIIVGGIILGTIGLASITKFQLFPEFDAQQIYISGKVDINNKLSDTEVYVSEIEDVILSHLDKNETDTVTSVVGLKFNKDQSVELGENIFQIFINLHEKSPENFFDRYINPLFSLEYDDHDMIRERFSVDIVKEVEEMLTKKFKDKEVNGKKIFEEFSVYAQQTGLVGKDIEVGFTGANQKKLFAAMKRVDANLTGTNGVMDIENNANEGERELKLRVNEYGQSLGFSESYLTSVLRGSFLKAEYSKIFDAEGLVRVKIEDIHKNKSDALPAFKLTTPDGQKVVRLGDICDFIYQKSFVKRFKEDGDKVWTLFAKVEKKVITPAEVMHGLEPLLKEIEDSGITLIIKGEEKENIQVKKEMSQAGLIAMFLIFIALVWMFNSLFLPLIILSTIPLSVIGAFIGTNIMGIHMSMPGLMGIVGLAGIVVNDGLIMLDFVQKSKDYEEMIDKAGMRLRPIILTSVTTVLGLSTLMFFASGQALILQPMAISLGFGVLWATVLNLFYVPVMYAIIYKVKKA